jgi:hypothetical protein
MRLCSLVMLAFSACAPAIGEQAHEEISATATLSFAADFRNRQSSALLEGRVATIHYDIARLPNCRLQYRGFPAWDILGYWAADGGRAQNLPLTTTTSAGRVGRDVTIVVPHGMDLALWFYASDEGGCVQWDSDYARDFHFPITHTAPALHFHPDWSITQSEGLRAGIDLTIDYDGARLPACRGDGWAIVMHWRADGGAVSDIPLTADVTAGRAVIETAIRPPAGARTLELWFEGYDNTGCRVWDSDFGRNFRFTF